MELRDLKYFCLTAEMEHVSKAAEKLGIAQPYLTKIIGGIEEELGGKLFDKVGRHIKLNDDGRAFYIHVKEILQSVDKMYAEMERRFEKKSRMITLLCNTESYTHDLILEFQKKNAEYSMKISYASSSDIAMAMRLGEADFAISTPPIVTGSASGLVTDIICRESVRVLFQEGHPFLKRDKVSLEDLKDERLITGTKGGAIRNHIDKGFEKNKLFPNIICETNDFDLIVKAVASGLGYAFIPCNTLLQNPELERLCVNLDSPDNSGEFGLTYNKNAIESPAMADFYNFTVSHFKALQKRIDREVCGGCAE